MHNRQMNKTDKTGQNRHIYKQTKVQRYGQTKRQRDRPTETRTHAVGPFVGASGAGQGKGKKKFVDLSGDNAGSGVEGRTEGGGSKYTGGAFAPASQL